MPTITLDASLPTDAYIAWRDVLESEVLDLPIDSHCGALCLAWISDAQAFIYAQEAAGRILDPIAIAELRAAIATQCNVCYFG